MNIYIFGNGNISFSDYKIHYEAILNYYLNNKNVHFIVCDFRGVDTLTMEVLKCSTDKVSIYHVGEQPRYLPDKFRTKVSSWKIFGGFTSDAQRDLAAINNCTHFIATDFNTDNKRESGTKKNIELCEKLGKIKCGKI